MANKANIAAHLRTKPQRLRVGGVTVSVSPVKPKPVKPVVYFIQDAEGHIKIGHSKQLEWRMASLQGAHVRDLKLLATRNGPMVMEREYHARFAAHRIRGEWFAPHPDILAEIERLSQNLSAQVPA